MRKKFGFRLFGGTKALETQIDEFLDLLSESNILYRAGLTYYLDNGGSDNDAFRQKLQQVDTMEHRADELRRSIELALYEQSLIPDSRADMLSLLEDLDYLMNVFEENLFAYSIESPDFPQEYHKQIKQLAEQVALSVESLVMAARAFLREPNAVRDHIHKVMLYEHEADQLSLALKTGIFKSNLSLERKAHLRHFVDKVEQVANEAEDVADWLAIYTIKRAA
jgi:predicted phosphate transport protein (TIGR00153 family)